MAAVRVRPASIRIGNAVPAILFAVTAVFGVSRALADAEWREATLPNSFKRLSCLSMLSSQSGWAGGRDGLLLEWNGRVWSRQTTPIQGDIVAIEFLSAVDGWIAAYDIGAQQTTLHHYDGTSWTDVAVPLGLRVTAMKVRPVQRVDGSETSIIWLFGQGGRILRYDGLGWTEPPSPGYRTPRAVTADRRGYLWTVGEFGTVWHWDGREWASIGSPVNTHLNGIALQDSVTLWAVGDGGVILRRSAGTWEVIESGTVQALNCVRIADPTEIWFCGSSAFLRWNGEQVVHENVSVHGHLRDMHILPDGLGWAVGYGIVLRRVPADRPVPDQQTLGFYRQELLPNALGIQGVAFGDVNGDGVDDLYLVSLRDANHLLINDGAGRFVDRTGASGLMGTVATSPWLRQVAQYGAVWGDVDNNGAVDLFVAGWHGATRFYEQTERGVFTDRTSRLPFVGEGPISANSGTFCDVNGDGYLDLFMTNEHGSNILWMNNGRGGWNDETANWGLTSHGGSKQAVFGDLDNDGDRDLFVCNWNRKNTIYRNDGDHFSDISEATEAAGDTSLSNGVTISDLDNDGDMDLVVTCSNGRNRIWRNEGNWLFTDATGIVGFASGPLSFGSVAEDFDNDGDLDIIIVNTDGTTYFQNVGGMEFVPTFVSGLTDIIDARAVAAADIDVDGDVDLFIGSRADLVDGSTELRNRRSACFINKCNRSHSITVRVEGVRSNRYGIGSRIKLWQLGEIGGERSFAAMREVTSSSGYFAQRSAAVHFGIPDTTVQYAVTVRFPNGREVETGAIRAGERVVVAEMGGVAGGISRLLQSTWQLLWTDAVQRHVWPLVIVVPLMVWGVRTTSNKLLWPPLWTTIYTIGLCIIYPMLAAATAGSDGWIARITPSFTVISVVTVTVLRSYFAAPRAMMKQAVRRQMDALAARANLTDVLSASTETMEVASMALREAESLFHLHTPSICLFSMEGDTVARVIPEGSWSDLKPGSTIPDAMRKLPMEDRAIWEPELEDLPVSPGEEWEPILLPLSTRQTHVGIVCGFIERRRTAEIVDLEPAMSGFAALIAMSLYNAELQEQARRKDEDYRKWLDSQVKAPIVTPKSVLSPAMLHRELMRKLSAARKSGAAGTSTRLLVGESEVIRAVLQQVSQVAASDTSVLITGESGTGKELAARTIHQTSKRQKGPFVAVNCGAIPSGLLESELFGHTKGAFTGAGTARFGVFQRADSGTIFLDEIGEMDTSAQVRLLRVLQERIITPVGGDATVKVDTRVIAATHRDLHAAVTDKVFREDLFYRLNVFPITMPPLRDRLDDIPDLVAALLVRISTRTNIAITGLSQDAVSRIMEYRWPGNVRELENTLERAVLLADGGLIDAEHIHFGTHQPGHSGEEHRGGETTPNDVKSLADIERETIVKALQECGNNVSETARKLDISRDKLRYRMKKYNISVDR